jgi:hypothetical protein
MHYKLLTIDGGVVFKSCWMFSTVWNSGLKDKSIERDSY